jgi:type VI secretion system secreted protein Hcp
MSQEEASRIARAAHRARRSRAVAKVALPTAAALGAGAAVAIGSIGGGNGTITACYGTNTVAGAAGPANFGAFRLIDPSLTINGSAVPPQDTGCTGGEATLDFNQLGPQGAAGAPGAKGANGANGATGAPGAALLGGTTFGISNPVGLIFMKIVGLNGTVVTRKHTDDIDVNSFQFGVAAGGSSSGGGAGAGKATLGSFSISKPIDSASPKWFAAEAAGTVFSKADIFLDHKVKGSEQDYLEINLSDVKVASVTQGVSSGGDRPTESVTFSFSKASESFVSANDKSISPQIALRPGG